MEVFRSAGTGLMVVDVKDNLRSNAPDGLGVKTNLDGPGLDGVVAELVERLLWGSARLTSAGVIGFRGVAVEAVDVVAGGGGG